MSKRAIQNLFGLAASPVTKVLLASGFLFVSAGGAAEIERSETSAVREARPRGASPRSLGSDAGLDARVEDAWSLAQDRLREVGSCRSLFDELGQVGSEILQRTIYVPAEARYERGVCSRRVAAFTEVGSSVTRLCRSFRRLPATKAAGVLLHEALHAAGLPESPVDPGASTSAEINARVADSCTV